MLLRVCAPTVRRVGEPHGGRSRAGRRPVVAHIHPQPPGARAPATRSKHRQGRIVGVDLLARSNVARQRLHQRVEQIRRAGHPVGKGGTFQPHALARVDRTLSVQRQVVAVLGGEHMGEQPGAGQAAHDRAAGGGRLHDGLAPAAGEFRAHVAHHPEAGRDVLQLFGHVLAQALQSAAALRAAAAGW